MSDKNDEFTMAELKEKLEAAEKQSTELTETIQWLKSAVDALTSEAEQPERKYQMLILGNHL